MPTIPSAPTETSVRTPIERLAQFRAELDAIPENAVLTPRVDVGEATATAVGAMADLERHRAALVVRFGERGTRALDDLVPHAECLLAAHAIWVAIADRDLEPAADELMRLQHRLVDARMALAERGLVRKKRLSRLQGGSAYTDRALDVQSLVAWFRQNAAAIATRSSISEAELASAWAAASAFLTLVGERERARAGASSEARERARAFALFFRTYETVRKMVAFLRWHEDDAEKIAPSLFARRRPHAQDDAVPLASNPPADTGPVPPGATGGDPFHTP